MLTVLSLLMLGTALARSGAEAYEFYELFEPASLYSRAQASRHSARPATETPCSVFFDQAPVQQGHAARAQYDQLVSLPIDTKSWSSNDAFIVHVNVHARFLAPSKGGAVAAGDLFVGLNDGSRVAGIMRTTPAPGVSHWAIPASGAAGDRAMPSESVVLARKAAGACSSDVACAAGAESFEVTFALGGRTSIAAVARGNNADALAATGIELADDLRQSGVLSVVLNAGGRNHAFEIAAVEVRVTRVSSAPSLAAFATVDQFVARASTERFSNVWPAFALIDTNNAVAVRGAGLAGDRLHALAEDGCGVRFETAEPVDGVAYSALLHLPLVKAGTLRKDRQYVVHVSVTAEANSPRNALLVGVADGTNSGAHVVGFVRHDRQSDALGGAVGGVLTRNHDELQFESRQFTTTDGGARNQDNTVPTHFEMDIVLGGGSTRVLAHAKGGASSLDAIVDTDMYGLDITTALTLVVMQRGERSRESSTLRLISATIDEVRVGCDGKPNSGKKIDACGVCGGTDECVGCDGVPLSGKLLDGCGVCGGDSSSCADCAGVPNGPARVDSCGVCGGADACLAGLSADAAIAFKKRAAERYADAGLAHSDAAGNTAAHLEKRAVLGSTPNLSVKDAVDCSGRLKREGGNLEYDACGVCGGNNECVGCDGTAFGPAYDDCGVCNGDNSTCCVSYCDIPNEYWDFMLLPVTLDNIIDSIELAHSTLVYLRDTLPDCENIDERGIATIQAGRMAEFNRVFLQDCLITFCAESGELYSALVHDNSPSRVIHEKIHMELRDI